MTAPRSEIHPNTPTKVIDERARELMADASGLPFMLGFRGFPAAVSVSIDEEATHGIPGSRTIEAGQLVTIQTGVRLGEHPNIFAAHQGWTFAVGAVGVLRKTSGAPASSLASPRCATQ